MSCPNTEKVALLYYRELPFSQKEEMERHLSNCSQCCGIIDTILKLDSMRITPSLTLQKIVLERAVSAGYSFSLREKVLAVGLCFALTFFFMVPKNSPSDLFYQDNDFIAIESEISAIKYDMADFSDPALDYIISCIDTSRNIEKEEV